VWLFDNPKTYPEMLKKIALTMLWVVAIGLFIFSNVSDDFSEFMEVISFGLQYEIHGFKLYISYIYIPLIFALIENVFKLHDFISDILKIRYKFDKYVIIKEFLLKCNKIDNLEKVNAKNRNPIMSNIFYKYAGYGNPCIDIHLIYMALGLWSWYWILLDTLLVSLILGLIYLINNFSWANLIVICCIVIFLNILMFIIKHFGCKKYAKLEVESILNDKGRKKEIYQYLSNCFN